MRGVLRKEPSSTSFTMMPPPFHNAATTLPSARLRHGIPNILPRVALGWRAETASTTSSHFPGRSSPTSGPVPAGRSHSRINVGNDSRATHGVDHRSASLMLSIAAWIIRVLGASAIRVMSVHRVLSFDGFFMACLISPAPRVGICSQFHRSLPFD